MGDVKGLIAAVAGLCLIMGVVWWQHGESDRNEIIKLEREKEISDAINSCADLHWSERLHCSDQ